MADASLAPMIATRGLSKYFGAVAAVRDVTLTVRPGEVVALLGPNGAGKTTTVRMLAAILMPSAGAATVAGLDIVQDAQRVRGLVGLLTEFPGLYQRMRAVEYLDFYGQLQGIDQPLRGERIESLLRRFDLWDTRHSQLGHYSKGMAQKLALIRAMLHDPPLLFLDEPTSAMDPHSARLVRRTIRWLRDQGKTIVICTHNLNEASELADRIAIIRGGEIIAFGTMSELRSRMLGGTLYEVRLAGEWGDMRTVLDPLVNVVYCGGNTLRYQVTNGTQINPLVLDTLSRAGAQVVTLTEVAGSLEEIYLSLIEAGAPDASAVALEGERA